MNLTKVGCFGHSLFTTEEILAENLSIYQMEILSFSGVNCMQASISLLFITGQSVINLNFLVTIRKFSWPYFPYKMGNV